MIHEISKSSTHVLTTQYVWFGFTISMQTVGLQRSSTIFRETDSCTCKPPAWWFQEVLKCGRYVLSTQCELVVQAQNANILLTKSARSFSHQLILYIQALSSIVSWTGGIRQSCLNSTMWNVSYNHNAPLFVWLPSNVGAKQNTTSFPSAKALQSV